MKEICAYCNLPVEKEAIIEITKEHVFPNFFYEKLELKLSKSKFYAFNSTINQFKKRELFTKDVCNICNNEKLSKLDIHFKKIADLIIDNEKKELTIDFEYDLLSRWLLKTIFNAYRFVELDTSSEIYKNYYVDYILDNKISKLPTTFIFGCSLEKLNFSTSFMSIGRIIAPSAINKYLNIFDFFQLKNYLFIIVSFKTNNEYKIHHEKTFKYLKENFYAKLIEDSARNFIFPKKSKLALPIIFNANEEGTSIPLKLFCKLQWNIDENFPSMKELVAEAMKSPAIQQLALKDYQENIYTTQKYMILLTNEITFILEKPVSFVAPTLFIKKWKYEEYKSVKEYNSSYAKIQRYPNLTIINIYDKNDFSKPFIRDLQVKQSNERWNIFKKNIFIQDNYIYIAHSHDDNILKQLKNESCKNLYFTSKVKVLDIKEHEGV